MSESLPVKIAPISPENRFRLDSQFLDNFRGKQPAFGPLGLVVYRRTYARQVPEEDRVEEFWETLRRVTEDVYSRQKQHMRATGQRWLPSIAKRHAQEFYQRMWDGKFLPSGRMLWFLGTEALEIKGAFACNNPLHADTKILTKEHGWVPLSEIEGQRVHVLSSTHDYGSHAERVKQGRGNSPVWAPATISNMEYQPCLALTFDDMHGNRTRIVSSKNHRWYRRRHKTEWARVSAEELRVGDYAPIIKPADSYKCSPQAYLHGMFFGDGTRSNGELHVFGEKRQVVKNLLHDSQYSVGLRDEEIVVRPCPIAWGQLPSGSYLEDDRYVFGFLAGYFAADGCVDCNGDVSLSSSRLDELTKVVGLLNKIGIRTTEPRVQVAEGANNNYTDNRSALYGINLTAIDIRPDFFLREDQREKWQQNVGQRRCKDWAKIVAIEPINEPQPVICAEVPGYEQFVTEGFILTSNCAMITTGHIYLDFARPFTFMMDALMCGAGVGFDTTGAGAVTIHSQPVSEDTFVIPDTREGWVSALGKVLNAFAGGDQLPKSFDYSQLRKAGEPIKTFGGISSGPEPLRALIERTIAHLRGLDGSLIRSTDIVDLMNYIGVCVVSGGVRRSSQIAMGDPDDMEFMALKDPAGSEGNPNHPLFTHRWASNNTLFADNIRDWSGPAKQTARNGEPGYAWLENMRNFGRMGDHPSYVDENVVGCNPCGEIPLESAELCNLSEVFPSNHDSLKDFLRTLKYAYVLCKTVSLIPTHDEETNAVVTRNRRLGIGVAGVTGFVAKYGMRESMRWLDNGYEFLRDTDNDYSRWMGVNRSIKLTTVKPGGSVAMVVGVEGGMKFPIAKYYLRTIRFHELDPMVQALRNAGHRVEQDMYAPNTMVAYFPVQDLSDARPDGEVSIWEKTSLLVAMQRYWSDNSVSATITFKPHEADEIPRILDMYCDQLKSISFLPLQDHGYPQAPYQAITEQQYLDAVAQLKPLDLSTSQHEAAAEDKYCSGDKCELPTVAA